MKIDDLSRVKNIFFYISVLVMSNFILMMNAQVVEKNLVILIPSYNNLSCYKKNLDSVFEQKYDNWRAIYIDDNSTDGTGDSVDLYIKERGFQERVTLIRNKKRLLAMANLYRAVHSCNNNEIILTLDGDDWFSHDQVFTLINEIYQDPNVWLTYGSYIDWPEPEAHVLEHWMNNFGGFGNRAVPSHVIENNLFRSFIGCTGQLRTFYAWLFKQIKLEDLMYESDFLPMTYDVGIMIPMHEMAQGKFKYVTEVVYIHNLDTPLNDHKVDAILQGNLETHIRNKPKYQKLNQPKTDFLEKFKKSKADLVAFSYNRPMQLYALLESITKYMTGINTATIIYRTSNDAFDNAYTCVKNDFPTVNFIKQNRKEEFKSLVLHAMSKTLADHIIFTVDDIIVKDYVNLNECIRYLEQTHTYGFYLRLGTHLSACYSEQSDQKVPHHVEIKDGICSWQFDCGEHDWGYPNTVDMTLYRKRDLLLLFEQLNFNSPNTLEGSWTLCKPLMGAGLFYEKSKIVNIPLNLVQQDACNPNMGLYSVQELLEKFEQGLKIDINPLYMTENESAHIDYEPMFVLRN